MIAKEDSKQLHRHDFDFKYWRTIDRKFRDEMPAMRLVHNAESVVFPGTPGFDIAGQSVASLC